MFYYKITGTVESNEIAEKLNDRQNGYMERSRFAAASEELCEKSDNKSFLFITSVSSNKNILMCLICADNRKPDKELRAFSKRVDIGISGVELTEITLKLVIKFLRDADRVGYVDSVDEVLDTFGVYSMYDRGYRPNRMDFEESILKNTEDQSVLESSCCFMAKEPLKAEIDRIRSVKKKTYASGHPVHYLIQTAETDEGKEAFKALIGNLYSHKRLLSKRYTTLTFYQDSVCYEEELETIYTNSVGGTVLAVFNYEDEKQSEYGSREIANLGKLASIMKKYSNTVLTVFWMSKKNEFTKKNLCEELGHTNLVEICDSTADCEQAKAYLKLLASEKKVKTDKKLFAKLESGKHYLASELNDMYDLWYSTKLKTVIFPQYKDISSVKSKVVKDGPVGCAYDELMDMIGLERAKTVIKQALDYNKAQKVFADKGMKFDRTSMHMVFTGNPGTAKTSVARLFAQIMKDNEVLTQGRLIECGRADLVGPFVGWTAPMVKKKFKEAKGSVLFIDEAYSLVDDKAGLFGDEAINTIVQEMENHRDDVVVIFAGYPDKMEQFLQRNPGLRSRIAYHVPFDDYNVDELCSIADLIAKKRDMILADDARVKLRDIFAVALKDDDFGNGRYVRNVLEKAKMAQASRLVAMDYSSVSSEDIKTIVASDIEMPAGKKKITRIGFCA